MTQIRLDKLLAHCGFGTRKQVKQIIRKGRVMVDHEVILKDDYKIQNEKQVVMVDGDIVEYREFVYIMLNKPQGYVSATEDLYYPTVIDLIEGYEHFDLFPVGRLDIDTEGLLLLTNDGDLAHQLLSPKKHVSKIYYVQIDGVVGQKDIELFKEGITLNDGYQCLSASLKILNTTSTSSETTIEIYEGKFHQVKKMFEAVGKKVTYLQRLQMKNLILDQNLPLGSYRELTDDEINDLKGM